MIRGITEREEIEAYREGAPRLGIEALGDTRELGKRISDSTERLLRSKGAAGGVAAVYVCGSFAEGRASAGISDLDVRIIITRSYDVTGEILRMIETELRFEGVDGFPGVAGYLDARIGDVRPGRDIPSKKIWPDPQLEARPALRASQGP